MTKSKSRKKRKLTMRELSLVQVISLVVAQHEETLAALQLFMPKGVPSTKVEATVRAFWLLMASALPGHVCNALDVEMKKSRARLEILKMSLASTDASGRIH